MYWDNLTAHYNESFNENWQQISPILSEVDNPNSVRYCWKHKVIEDDYYSCNPIDIQAFKNTLFDKYPELLTNPSGIPSWLTILPESNSTSDPDSNTPEQPQSEEIQPETEDSESSGSGDAQTESPEPTDLQPEAEFESDSRLTEDYSDPTEIPVTLSELPEEVPTQQLSEQAMALDTMAPRRIGGLFSQASRLNKKFNMGGIATGIAKEVTGQVIIEGLGRAIGQGSGGLNGVEDLPPGGRFTQPEDEMEEDGSGQEDTEPTQKPRPKITPKPRNHPQRPPSRSYQGRQTPRPTRVPAEASTTKRTSFLEAMGDPCHSSNSEEFCKWISRKKSTKYTGVMSSTKAPDLNPDPCDGVELDVEVGKLIDHNGIPRTLSTSRSADCVNSQAVFSLVFAPMLQRLKEAAVGEPQLEGDSASLWGPGHELLAALTALRSDQEFGESSRDLLGLVLQSEELVDQRLHRIEDLNGHRSETRLLRFNSISLFSLGLAFACKAFHVLWQYCSSRQQSMKEAREKSIVMKYKALNREDLAAEEEYFQNTQGPSTQMTHKYVAPGPPGSTALVPTRGRW